MKSDELELERERFQVINETPIAGKVLKSLNQSLENSIPVKSRHISSTPNTSRISQVSYNESPTENINPVKTKSAAEIFQRTAGVPAGGINDRADFSPAPSRLIPRELFIEHNTKTPDLDRVKVFLRDNRTPGNDLMSKMKLSPEDTPTSQRVPIDIRPRMPSINDTPSDMRGMQDNDLNRVTETSYDMSDNVMLFQEKEMLDNCVLQPRETIENQFLAIRQVESPSKVVTSKAHVFEETLQSRMNHSIQDKPKKVENSSPSKVLEGTPHQAINTENATEISLTDQGGEPYDGIQSSTMRNTNLLGAKHTQEFSDVIIPATNSSSNHTKYRSSQDQKNKNSEDDGSLSESWNHEIGAQNEQRTDYVNDKDTSLPDSENISKDQSEDGANYVHPNGVVFVQKNMEAVTQCDQEDLEQENKGQMKRTETNTQVLPLTNDKRLEKTVEEVYQDTQVDISLPIPEPDARLIPKPSGLCSSPILMPNLSQSVKHSQFFDKNGPTQIIESPFSTTQKSSTLQFSDGSKIPSKDDHPNSTDNSVRIEAGPLTKTTDKGTPFKILKPVDEGSSDNDGDSEKRVLLRFSNKNELQYDLTTQKQSETNKDILIYSDVELTQELPEIEDVAIVENSDIVGLNHEPYQSNQDNSSEDSPLEDLKNCRDSSGFFNEESQEIVKSRRWSRKRKRSGGSMRSYSSPRSLQRSQIDKQSSPCSPKRRLRRAAEIKEAPKISSSIRSLDIIEKQPIDIFTNGLNTHNQEIPLLGSETQITELGPTTSSQGTPSKIQYSESASFTSFPETIRTHDDEYLSKKDIIFPAAVWCHYSLNYVYYPGKLLSNNRYSEVCEVLFESSTSMIKREDIHYLDIRIGDTVNWKEKPYTVIALECLTNEQDVIRCIRGFDTVHLKRKNNNGNLGKRTLIKPLSSITLTLSEWAKRPKIILSGSSQSRANAFEDLRYPIRGRKNTTVITPVSPKKCTQLSEDYEFDSNKQNTFRMKSATVINPVCNVAQVNSSKSHSKGIFDKCLFVLTGLGESCREDISDMISSQDGIVINNSFSSFLNYTEERQFSWNEPTFASYRFVCLITEKHLRSLKYLEALALGWPTLHWKFINHCMQKKKLDIMNVFNFLLPSGESHRLSVNPNTKTGVVKSSNIFQFYSNLMAGASLGEQLNSRLLHLTQFKVLIYGKSEFNGFIEFIFHVFGVLSISYLEYVYDGHKGPRKLSEHSNEGSGCELDLIREIEGKCVHLAPEIGILVYINERNSKNTVAETVKENTFKALTDKSNLRNRIFVESKEWLIQTIINADTGFDE